MGTNNTVNLSAAGIAKYDGAGSFSAITLTQYAVLIGASSNGITSIGPLTDGQLAIGSTGGNPVAAALTAGTGISVTNSSGGIQIDATGGGVTWAAVGVGSTLLVNHGYICTTGAALSFALPGTSSVGATIHLALNGSTSWTITQGANQQIRLGSSATTLGAGGSIASTSVGDSITLVCVTANLTWMSISAVGNLTIV